MSTEPHIADAEEEFFVISVTPDMCQVGKSIVMLHSFVKKTQETPDAELRLARKRLKDVQNG